jgi:hypothetical protein
MKNFTAILFYGLIALSAANAADLSTPKQHTEILGNGRFRIIGPIRQLLSREAAADRVYYSRRFNPHSICNELGYDAYEPGSVQTESGRFITTKNLLWNRIGYRIDPMARLAGDYEYPKGKRVKEIICTISSEENYETK